MISLTDAYKDNDIRHVFPKVLPLLTQIVFSVDTQNNTLRFYNENRLQELLGYTLHDVHEWNNDLLHMIWQEDKYRVTVELSKVFVLEPDTSYSFDCRANQKSGNCKHVKVTGSILSCDKQGKAISFLYMMEDITEKINQERKIAFLQLHNTTNTLQTSSDLLGYKEMITDREYFLNQGSWETNLQTGETNWSKGMYYIFGYETDEQIRNVEVTNILHLSHMNEEK